APSCKRPTSPGGLCEAVSFIRTRQPDIGRRCCGVAAVQLTLRPAVLPCDLAALDTGGFFETMPDRVARAGFTIGAIKQADHRHRLLRARRERPRSRATPRPPSRSTEKVGRIFGPRRWISAVPDWRYALQP